MLINFKKLFNYKLIILVILVFVHFLWLDRFPVGMTNDELEYILSSKSYALTGKDISGVSFPMSLFKTQTEGAISAIPAVLISPLYLIMPLNQTTARIPYVVINLATALLLYLLCLHLFKNPQLGFLASILFLINPWSFYLSRYTVDSPLALFFYLAGIITLLKFKGIKLIIPFVLFILGFFSYHGAKPILIPIILAVLGYRLLEKSINPKNAVLFVLALIIFVGGFVYLNKIIPGSILTNRSQDLFFLNNGNLSRFVDEGRRLTIGNPLTNILTNKPTVILDIFIQKYLTAFSTDVLFLHGDPRAAYRFEDYGLFFGIDFIFIIFGIVFLFQKYKKVFWLIFSLMLIAPIPTAISGIDTSVVNRSFLLLPMLILLSGIGVYELVNIFHKGVTRNVIIILVSSLYLFGSVSFLVFYFFHFPVTHQENYLLSERVLNYYLTQNKNPKVVIAEQPRTSYLRAIFYANADLQRKALVENANNFNQGKYNINNIDFIGDCINKTDDKIVYAISRDKGKCFLKNKSDFSITDQKDGGDVFLLFNDKICQNKAKDSWRRYNYLSDYLIESLSVDSFCERWVSKR